MTKPIERRFFLGASTSLALSIGDVVRGDQPGGSNGVSDSVAERIRGLLYGGLIGDALGGPVEFGKREVTRSVLPNTRDWPRDRTIEERDLQRWSAGLEMYSYESLRPRPAAYGPWLAKAPAGTTTDDTRHKVVLMRALESLRSKGQKLTSIDSQGLAQAYLDYEVAGKDEIRNQLKKHVEEGFREYRYAARWILGQREPSVAKPVERLWAGIDNCSGQMMLPPLACMYPGKPGEAYRKAFQIDFIDAPGARDMAAAWLAGLAAVLGEKETDPARQRWSVLWDAMRSTDPFEFSKTPFAGRPLHRWMDLAMDVAERANGRPWRLFELLETDGRPLYWWDAHYTLLVPISILVFCQYKPLAAMRLTMDFGHDSDSYLQTLGCMVGAVYGEGIFDKAMRSAIDADMARQYGASIESWMAVFSGA